MAREQIIVVCPDEKHRDELVQIIYRRFPGRFAVESFAGTGVLNGVAARTCPMLIVLSSASEKADPAWDLCVLNGRFRPHHIPVIVELGGAVSARRIDRLITLGAWRIFDASEDAGDVVEGMISELA